MSQAIALILALIGVPLFAVMAQSALFGHWSEEIDLQAVIISFYSLAELEFLDSLPLFAFSGYLLARSNAPQRLLRVSNVLVGWLPGGLAIVTIWVCTLVTALTGASGVTIIALGGLLFPALLKSGYPERFSLGVTTTGGSLGLLFPPSLPVILFGVVSETSIEDLFVAGILPGLLILTLLSGYAAFQGGRQNVPRVLFSWQELVSAGRGAIWELPIPILIALGVYSGKFTVSEAAVIVTTYLLFVEVVIYRDIQLRQIGSVARESMVLAGGILIILGMTMAVTNYIITVDLPQRLFEWIQPYITSKYAFLLALNLFLLLVGCMIDIYAAIALVVPLILPIAAEYEVDSVHLGIIFLANMGIGYATPPVGLNLFIASVRFKQPILKIYWSCIPFLVVLLLALAAITYFPPLSLWLLSR